MKSKGQKAKSEEQRAAVAGLIYTSVDDCRTSLKFRTDIPTLELALKAANRRGEKTKAKLIESRIKQLLRAEALKPIPF